MDRYAQDKIRQRETVGYDDEDRHGFKVTFSAANEDELAEGLLGRRPLQVTSMAEFERRFDVTFPSSSLFPPELGLPTSVRIDPTPPLNCQLKLEAASGESVTLDCGIAATPLPLKGRGHRLIARVKCRMFDFYIKPGKIDIQTAEYVSFGTRHSLDDWQNYFRTYRILGQVPTSLIILEGERHLLNGTITDTISWSDELAWSERLLSKAADLFFDAGIARPHLTMTSIIDQRRAIATAHLFRDHPLKLTFSVANVNPKWIGEHKSALAFAIQVGEAWLALSLPVVVNVTSDGQHSQWVAYGNGNLSVEQLSDPSLEGFDRFRQKVVKLSGRKLVLSQSPGEFLGDICRIDGFDA